MKRRISHVCTFGFALMLLGGTAALLPQTSFAQASEYQAGEGVELVWTLGAHDNPDLFTRGPAFGARSVLTGMDFDGDGFKEFLFTTDETLAPGGPDPGILDVYLYENTGDNTYEYVWSYSHPEGSNSLPPIAYGDIDEDGLWEIYFGVPTLPSGGEPDDTFIFEQNEDGTFPDAPTTAWGYERDVAADFRPAGYQIVDVDGDGQQELITVSRTSGAREVIVATPDNGIDTFTTWTIEFEAGNDLLGGGSLYDVDTADFDNDGNMEIWVNTWNNFSFTIFEATGPDTYALQVDFDELIPVNDPGSFNSHALLFYDGDGDGIDELFLPMTDGKLYCVAAVDDVSTLTAESFQVIGTFDETARARGGHLGDLDGDGQFDIVAGSGTSETLVRIEYQGGALADSSSYNWTTILDSSGGEADRYYPLRITDDLDGDGMNEVVVTNLFASVAGQPLILILEATGDPVAVEPIGDLPEGYALSANYPNPFNPTTQFDFTLAASEQVSVRVYDVQGRLVNTLVDNQRYTAGVHQVAWDATDALGQRVPSGAYFYSLEFGTYRQVRTMVLLK